MNFALVCTHTFGIWDPIKINKIHSHHRAAAATAAFPNIYQCVYPTISTMFIFFLFYMVRFGLLGTQVCTIFVFDVQKNESKHICKINPKQSEAKNGKESPCMNEVCGRGWERIS